MATNPERADWLVVTDTEILEDTDWFNYPFLNYTQFSDLTRATQRETAEVVGLVLRFSSS